MMSLERRFVLKYKMSLKVKSAMLGIDSQVGNEPRVEPGAVPGVFAGQRCSRFQRTESRRGLRLGKWDAGAAGLFGDGTRQPWADPPIRREDDRLKPRTNGALIGQYLRGEPVRVKAYRRHRFRKRYDLADIQRLAAVDAAHDVSADRRRRR